jgi:hypothetical protein
MEALADHSSDGSMGHRWKLYSDISRLMDHPSFGWCYLIVEEGKIIVGPVCGTALITPARLATWLEIYPVERARRQMPFTGMEVMTDHPSSLPEARLVDRSDPFYLICHYAAYSKVMRAKLNSLTQQKKS